MMSMRHIILVILTYIVTSASASACSVCMGAKNGSLAEATNGAIFLLLGILAVVLIGVTAVGVALVRRSKRFELNSQS